MPGEAIAEFAAEIERRWRAVLPVLIHDMLVLQVTPLAGGRRIVAGRPVAADVFEPVSPEAELVHREEPALARAPVEEQAAERTHMETAVIQSAAPASGGSPAQPGQGAGRAQSAATPMETPATPPESTTHAPAPSARVESAAPSGEPVAQHAEHPSPAPPANPQPPVHSEPVRPSAPATPLPTVRPPGWYERHEHDVPAQQPVMGQPPATPSHPSTAEAGHETTPAPPPPPPSTSPAPAPPTSQGTAPGTAPTGPTTPHPQPPAAHPESPEAAELRRLRTVGPPRHYEEMPVAAPGPPAAAHAETPAPPPHSEATVALHAVPAEAPAGASQPALVHAAPRPAGGAPPALPAGAPATSAAGAPATPTAQPQVEGWHAEPPAQPAVSEPAGVRGAPPQPAAARTGERQAPDRNEIVRQVLKQFAHEMAWEAERRGMQEWS
jgi:hypothetical protein